jgi:hypothetical protein
MMTSATIVSSIAGKSWTTSVADLVRRIELAIEAHLPAMAAVKPLALYCCRVCSLRRAV